MISDLADDYPDRFAVVTAHVNGDGYVTPWGQSRLDAFYGLASTVPSFMVDGMWSCPSGDYRYCLETQLGVTTDVTLELSAAQTGGSTWNVTTRVCLESGSSRQMRLYTAATLNDYPNPPSTSRNVLMQDVFEELVTVPGGGCQLVTTGITLDPVSAANESDIVVVAWAQAPSGTGPAEVYQAGIMRWPFPASSQLTSIEISPTGAEVEVGDQVQLTATGRDQFGDAIALVNPSWTLSGIGAGSGTFDPPTGSAVTTFTATAAGSRQLTCQDQGVTGSAPIVIVDTPRLTTIEVDPGDVTVDIGGQVGFTATGRDQFGATFPLSNPAWSLGGSGPGGGSFDPAVGSPTTTFTATAAGFRVVVCQDGSVTGTAAIVITDPPRLQTIEIDPASVEIQVDGEVSFLAVGKDQFGSDFDLADPAWSVSGDGHGTFDPAIGAATTFTADAVGSCVVSCTQGAVVGRATVVIVDAPPRLATITVSPAEAELRVGGALELVAAGADQYGEPFALDEPRWRLEGTGDGVLDPVAGPTTTFTATAAGAVRLICSDDGVEGSATVDVVAGGLPAPRKATRRMRP